MEELQKTLVAKICEQLKSDKPNIQYLDVLNRLLGTVSDFILSDNQRTWPCGESHEGNEKQE